MMKLISMALAGALVLALAGCSDEKPAEPEKPAATEPATQPPAQASDAKAPESPPKADAAAPASSSDVSQAAIDACLAAVKGQTEGELAVLSTEFSEANSQVMVGVGESKAPWKCLVSNDGKGAEVSFAGDDGDGPGQAEAPEPAPASSSDVSQAAIDACLAAVKAETSESDQAVLSTEFSEANSQVMVGVGANRAPWKCLVGNDGTGATVESEVDEGAL